MIIRIRKSVILLLLCMMIVLGASMISSKAEKTFASQSVGIPIIMYHQISRTKENTGKYVINERELEKDLIYLKDKGYETLSVSDIISYVEGQKNLPEKCVMLTFDDGYETGFTVLYPLLKKYKMKAVLSVVGSLTQLYTENEDHNDRYSYLDEEEIRLLSSSEEIEIQNHSYNMHYCEKGRRKGINKIYGESYDIYKSAITYDVGKMQEYLMKLTGRLPEAMAYPFGEYCKETTEICKTLGFKVTFTCEEKVSTITKYQRESLFDLGRFNRSGLADREEFFSKVLLNTENT